MEITKINDLSFYNDQGILTIPAKQYDTGRKFCFNIIADDEPLDLSECDVYLRILKADGTLFQGHECCIISDNSVIVDTSVSNGNQILASAGMNKCELHLKNNVDGKTLTTWNFNIEVFPRVHDGSHINSNDSWDEWDRIKDTVDDYRKKLEENYFVIGVKGNTEKSYRKGEVNLTAENVGALPISGGIITTGSGENQIEIKETGIYGDTNSILEGFYSVEALDIKGDTLYYGDEDTDNRYVQQYIINENKPIWDDKYTKDEIDNKFSMLETDIDWKESVISYSDIIGTYPHPENGWTVNVKDTNYTYRYNGTEWIPISANAIPKATQEVDGLLSRNDKALIDSIKNLTYDETMNILNDI